MVNRVVVVGAAIAAIVLWLGPISIPGWGIVAFLIVVSPFAIAASVKQKRMENRLVRTLWKAVTRTSRLERRQRDSTLGVKS